MFGDQENSLKPFAAGFAFVFGTTLAMQIDERPQTRASGRRPATPERPAFNRRQTTPERFMNSRQDQQRRLREEIERRPRRPYPARNSSRDV
ncbi:hypothetical protein CLAFUW4_11024 [Fulvia fulva]|uniref:Uncharacterized protein n=1 Tax=Passalora fulva TaxID=5499 RepID=A0A9Q8URD2_PASFU|nr:uncharacterized protein CLAFUR5_10066 [Fulvia fulva]KAK4619842.1 hypothetical protein CLAFUR4_11029 [Fulvia fulva]KAK4620743.1 hypothetical protein CLAFUR0_11035 [Fulvia fulva]UJO19587.1 hypothetical protein CLAFUR5_10066 [Fulvia fulva]WPV17581.1 hypothetical protein CLAFUW4_11024 [Fulvia fulva]WPV32556.1 hypothetical protein CLAFUW7_11021 [Fulvia fulva]